MYCVSLPTCTTSSNRAGLICLPRAARANFRWMPASNPTFSPPLRPCVPAIGPSAPLRLTCTIAALKVFGPVYALTGGGPGTATIVPAYYAYSEFFQSQQVGYGATIATALTIVIAAVSVVFILVQNRVEKQEGER